MDLGSFLILLAVFLLTALIIVRPFFEDGQTQPRPQGAYSSLLAEKERILTAIEDLEQEYWLKKIPEDNYQRKRKYLLEIAARVLKELDQLKEKSPFTDEGQSAEEKSPEKDPLEALIESRRKALRQKSMGFCPQCGTEVFRRDQFCGHCGESL